jgi:hypothetical protein
MNVPHKEHTLAAWQADLGVWHMHDKIQLTHLGTIKDNLM